MINLGQDLNLIGDMVEIVIEIVIRNTSTLIEKTNLVGL